MPKIAIISPNKEAVSESFIRAHIEGLNFEKDVLWGGHVPVEYNGRPIYRRTAAAAALRRLSCFRRRIDFEKHAVAKLLRKLAPDLVFAEYGQTGAEMTDVCRRLDLPLVVHFHGYDAYRDDVLAAYRERYRAMFRHAARVIAVSHAMEDQLRKLGAPEQKLVYSPCGPQPFLYGVAPDFASGRLLAVGRFVHKKAPFLTILAFKKALAARPGLTLTMVGGGPLLDTCKMMARALGLEGALSFAGPVDHGRIHEFFAAACCFVQHSVTAPDNDSEGTPVGVLEACASGLPVVATRHAGIQDIIVHGQTGLLVDEFDVDGMADAIIALAGSRETARRMGDAGRAFVAEHFSLQGHLARLERAIREALQR